MVQGGQSRLTIEFLANIKQAQQRARQLGNEMEALGAKVRRVGAEGTGMAQQSGRATQAIQDQTVATVGLTQRVHDLGGRMQGFGQSMALGFTVPLIASSLVLRQFDESAARLQVGEAFGRVAKQFDLGADEIVAALQEASGGTIDNLSLMGAASRAMVLGVGSNIDEFVQLMEIARDRARIFGLTTTQAFNDLTLGIGRQSRLILDNLGILVRMGDANKKYAQELGKTVDSLTDQERRQAFLNAVLEQTEATIDRTALATRTSSEEYMANRAQISDLMNTVSMNFLPILNKLLSGFNALPAGLRQFAMSSFAIMIVIGPLSSAMGAIVRLTTSLLMVMGKIIPTLIAAGSAETILAIQTQAANTALVGQTAAARAASASMIQLSAAGRVAAVSQSGFAASTLAAGRGVGLLLARFAPWVAITMAAVGGLRTLWAILSEGKSVMESLREGFNLATLGLFKKLPFGIGDAYKTDNDRLQEQIARQEQILERGRQNVEEKVNAIQGAFTADLTITVGTEVVMADLRKLTSSVEDSVERIGVSFTRLKEVDVEFPAAQAPMMKWIADSAKTTEISVTEIITSLDELDSRLQGPFGHRQAFEVIENLFEGDLSNQINALTGDVDAFAGAMKDMVPPATLKNIYESYYRLAEAGDAASLVIATKLWSAWKGEILAHEAVQAVLGDTVVAYKELKAELQGMYAEQTALGSVLSFVTARETQEELQLQKTSAQIKLATANRTIELGGITKTKAAIDEINEARKEEVHNLDLYIKGIDLEIRALERQQQALIPTVLLDEIEALEAGVRVEDRHARSIEREIRAIERRADELERDLRPLEDRRDAINDEIDAIERQARAVERLNRPLERQVRLYDIQARRVELMSRPARDELERLQKIPGLSQDVVRAQEKIVQEYDDQINAIRTQADWLQLEIDQRQIQIDLIRDQTYELENERDVLDDVIDARQDEVDAVRDSTRGLQDEVDIIRDNVERTRDLIEKKRDYIETLDDPRLQREIDKLKQIKDNLQFQRDKMQLVVDWATPFKQTTGSMMDPLLADLQTANAVTQAEINKLAAIKALGVIEAKLRLTSTPSFGEVLFLLEAIRKGIPVPVITGVVNTLRMLRDWGASQGQINWWLQARASSLGIALPAFQHGGIVQRPTYGLLAEHGPEAVIPLDRALPGGMAAPNIYITVDGYVGDREDLRDWLMTEIRRELR